MKEDTAHSGYWYLQGNDLPGAALIAPEKIATLAGALAPIADAAITERAAEVGDGQPKADAVSMMSFANLVECTGGVLAPAIPRSLAGARGRWRHAAVERPCRRTSDRGAPVGTVAQRVHDKLVELA